MASSENPIIPKSALARKIFLPSSLRARKPLNEHPVITPPGRKAPFTVKVDKMPSENLSIVANEFNNFFCAIGPNLAEKIEHISNKRPEDFFHKKVISSIYFEPPAVTEVFDQIMALKNKAVGHNIISSFFLKATRHVITPYLHQLIDYSFNEGTFPNMLQNCENCPQLQKWSKR